MASNTPRGVQYPTELDKIKDGSSPSALADDFRDLAATTDAAIADGVAEAVADAATKYGGLPSRVTAVEQKNVQQDQAISDVSDRVQTLLDTTQAIDAPKGFDANTVNGQAVHAVNTVDSPVNMPGDGSWMLFTWPQLGAQQQQLALKFDIAGPEMHARVRTGEGWGSWNRLDANKWAERLDAIESKNSNQDNRLFDVETKNIGQDQRLDGLERLRPVKSVRLENGKWVWDPRNATHYVLIDHNGKPTARSTPWPIPDLSTPTFSW